MTRRAVRWTRRAIRRLDDVGAYISPESPAAADRVIGRILDAIDLLATQPAMGRPGRLPGTRELVLADMPYIVAYRVKNAEIEILTIMHAAQRWPQHL